MRTLRSPCTRTRRERTMGHPSPRDRFPRHRRRRAVVVQSLPVLGGFRGLTLVRCTYADLRELHTSVCVYVCVRVCCGSKQQQKKKKMIITITIMIIIKVYVTRRAELLTKRRDRPRPAVPRPPSATITRLSRFYYYYIFFPRTRITTRIQTRARRIPRYSVRVLTLIIIMVFFVFHAVRLTPEPGCRSSGVREPTRRSRAGSKEGERGR